MKIPRKGWRPLMERWIAMQRVTEVTHPNDKDLHSRTGEILEDLFDARMVDIKYRKKMAETLRALRALSKELGVSAARPLPSSSPAGSRPDTGPYRIAVSDTYAGPCVECGDEVGAGPIGWRQNDEPGQVCDSCLGESSLPLAAVLIIANCMREVGELESLRDEDEAALGSLLLTTGMLYERSSFEGLPIRRIDLEVSLIPLLGRLSAAYEAIEGEDGGEAVSH